MKKKLNSGLFDINLFEMSVTERKPLESGTIYYIPNLLWEFCEFKWFGSDVDIMLLYKRMIHLSKENTILHTKCLQQIIKTRKLQKFLGV